MGTRENTKQTYSYIWRKIMKKQTVISGIVGFVAGFALLAVIMLLAAPSLMIVENKSTLNYEETIAAIEKAAAEGGWKIPTIHHIDKSVAKGGFDVKEVAVIELCKVDLAGQILQDDKSKVVTSMMPCRLSVYKTADDQVIVSRMNTGLVSKIFGGKVAEVMKDATAGSEKILDAVL